MIIDYLIAALVIWGITAGLNRVFFKDRGASRLFAWSVSITLFIVSVPIFTVLKVMRYQHLSESAGTTISPSSPVDLIGPLIITYLFFRLLHKRAKHDIEAKDVGG